MESVSLSGAVFYEGRENRTEYHELYREKPDIQVELKRVIDGNSTVREVTQSHLFDFNNLERNVSYELTVTS